MKQQWLDSGIGTTRMGQRIFECVLSIGTRSEQSIMASGFTAAQTGRTRDRTLLAQSGRHDRGDPCPRTSASSFDQVVGNGKYAGRNRESECLSSRQINNELEFRWLLDRKIRRACTLENLIHIPRSTPEEVHFIRAIGDEAAVRREIAEKVNCRHTVLRGEFDNPLAMNPIMTVWQNEKATVWFAPDLANGILNVGFAMHLDWDRLYP